jgi:hypothetical protein
METAKRIQEEAIELSKAAAGAVDASGAKPAAGLGREPLQSVGSFAMPTDPHSCKGGL